MKAACHHISTVLLSELEKAHPFQSLSWIFFRHTKYLAVNASGLWFTPFLIRQEDGNCSIHSCAYKKHESVIQPKLALSFNLSFFGQKQLRHFELKKNSGNFFFISSHISCSESSDYDFLFIVSALPKANLNLNTTKNFQEGGFSVWLWGLGFFFFVFLLLRFGEWEGKGGRGRV